MRSLNRRNRTRRGVLLLVVLGLLSMFGLMALAFLIVTGQAQRSAKIDQRLEQYADPPPDLAHQAAMQVIRGSNDPVSVLGPLGLLEDLYGTGSIADTLQNVEPICNGQFVSISPPPFAASADITRDKVRCIGNVLTITSGPSAGQSTRIVAFDSANDRFHLMAFAGQTVDIPNKKVYVNGRDPTGSSYLINGIPFSGTGFGADATGAFNRQDTEGVNFALRPNPTAISYPIISGNPTPNRDYWDYLKSAAGDAANEDYDAPDYQNMLMALMVINGAGAVEVPSPSLHRPELINYWYQRLFKLQSSDTWSGFTPGELTTWGNLSDLDKWKWILNPRLYATDAGIRDKIWTLKRKISLRPLREDNPNFDGGNQGFVDFVKNLSIASDAALLATSYWDLVGPWDADNDGDGVKDSIFVDLGSPVRSTSSGRMYKPLYAILCLDQDGRLNLNAHGSTAQLAAGYDAKAFGPFANQVDATASPPDASNGSVTLPRGEGYGPADVRLSGVVSAAGEAARLLQGDNAAGVQGRYGESTNGTAQAGRTGLGDTLSLIKHFEFPADPSDIYLDAANNDFTLVPSKLTSFVTPSDLWGRGCLGLDHRGMPFYRRQQWTNEVLNNPYRLNLSQTLSRPSARAAQSADNPFSPAELERVLRQYDVDAGLLANRLVTLAPSLVGLRTEVTTDSYDLPVPGTSAGVVASGQRAKTVSELLRDRIIQEAGFTLPLNVTQEKTVNDQIAQLLAWDLLSNRRMDINRPLGNGRDNQGNNVVDEAEESGTEAAWNNLFPKVPGSIPFQLANGLTVTSLDLNGDGTVDWRDQNLMARQVYARHLFVLALLVLDKEFYAPGGVVDEPKLQRIAQWAVNVVDFRDADSIMTPFEYVLNPFDTNGWNVDGLLSTDETDPGNAIQNPNRRVVWGCEYPDLLLTETFACHDRCVADTAWDAGKKTKRDDATDPDATLDQVRIPQGSAFFELYCTGNPNNAAAPGDLYEYYYDTTTKAHGWRLNLGKMAPAGGADNLAYPVWRLTVKTGTTMDRIVWLATQAPTKADPAATPPVAGHEDWSRIYYSRNTANPLLLPGAYAVVGPRAVTAIGSRRDVATPNKLGLLSTQQIQLAPVKIADAAKAYPDTTTDIQVPLGIVAAADPPSGWTNTSATAPNGIGINVSEPLPTSTKYYPEPSEANASSGLTDAYGDLDQQNAAKLFPDLPLDSRSGMPLTGLTNTNTSLNFRNVYLERLANPLQAYDPKLNPYVPIDLMPLDLTVFNGEDRRPASWATGQWDPDDSNPTADNLAFQARHRGNPRTYAPNSLVNLWRAESENPDSTTADGTFTVANFRHRLSSTLGFVNESYGDPWSMDPAKHSPPAPPAYCGTPISLEPDPGDPSKQIVKAHPFPWLAWNNRPFATPAELLLVPSSAPDKLTQEYSLLTPGNPYNNENFTVPFAFTHLANFFGAKKSTTGSPPASPHLYRILDFVEVPSRFVGTETVLDPSAFNALQPNAVLHMPPFNAVSRYRDPGRVNLNTISSSGTAGGAAFGRVWNAVLNGHAGPSFADLAASRRGYDTVGAWWAVDNNYPTRFANPFRTSAGADKVPQITPDDSIRLTKTYPVNATLLRAATTNPDASAEPLFRATYSEDYRKADRDPYFRYEGLSRLSNMVTTRSNVYAVWITVGYFEVEPTGTAPLVDLAHPDGYQLGKELGSDTGEVTRHRAFYLIDRSIPVGFQRGMDLNAEKTILLRRFIE